MSLIRKCTNGGGFVTSMASPSLHRSGGRGVGLSGGTVLVGRLFMELCPFPRRSRYASVCPLLGTLFPTSDPNHRHPLRQAEALSFRAQLKCHLGTLRFPVIAHLTLAIRATIHVLKVCVRPLFFKFKKKCFGTVGIHYVTFRCTRQ